MNRILVLGLFLLGFAAESSAQTSPLWAVGGTAGAGRTWDDEGQIGSGWLLGGYVQRRLGDRSDLEFSVDLLTHDRQASGESRYLARGHTTYLSATFIRRFGGRDANFFLLGGGTFGIHRGEAGFADETLADTDSAHGGFIVGGGLSFRTRGIEISPLVRMTWMAADTDSDPASSIMAGVRIGR